MKKIYIILAVLMFTPNLYAQPYAFYCNGSYPFWHLNIFPKKIHFQNENSRLIRIMPTQPKPAVGRDGTYTLVYETKTVKNERPVTFVINLSNSCTIATSRDAYQYNVTAIFAKQIYAGCCNKRFTQP